MDSTMLLQISACADFAELSKYLLPPRIRIMFGTQRSWVRHYYRADEEQARYIVQVPFKVRYRWISDRSTCKHVCSIA